MDKPRLEWIPDEPSISAAPRGAEAGPRLEFLPEEPPKPPMTPEQRQQEAINEAKGVGRAMIGEAGRSIPGTLVGGLGSVETFALKDLPTFARNVMLSAQEARDWISPAEAEKRRQQPVNLSPTDQTPGQEAGYNAPFSNMPTYKNVTETVKKFGKDSGLPILAEEPSTPSQKIAAEAVKGAAQGLPGAVHGTIGRLAAGAVSGALGESAGQATEGQPNEGFWRLAGALGGGLVGAKLANAILPSIRAKDELADAIAKDIKSGQMSVDDIQRAIAEGRDLSGADFAGPNTLAILQRASGTSLGNTARANQFNNILNERKGESGVRIQGAVDEVFGMPVDAPAFTRLQEAAGEATRDRVWNLARSNPNAQSIPDTITAGIGDRPALQTAIERANKNIQDLPSSFDIQAPTPGTPGQTGKILKTDRGWETTPDVPATPGQPGNLNYWHQVDRELGAMIKAAKADPDQATKLAGLTETQKELRQRLYKAVPEYENALSMSARTFQGESAPEAGFNFAQTLFTAKQNPFKRAEVAEDFARMTPENQEALRVGVGHFIAQKAMSGQIGPLARKFETDRNFQRDMRTILGEERYNQIAGSVLAESVVHRLPAITPTASHGWRDAGIMGGMTGVATAMAEGVPAMLATGQAVDPQTWMKVTAALMLGSAARGVHQLGEKNVANAMLPMMLSRDPKDLAEFGKLVTENPTARRLFNRLTTTLSVAERQAEERSAREEQRQGRSTGGAVNLRALANSARKAVTKSTEELLQTPDEHVVKALEVANRHI